MATPLGCSEFRNAATIDRRGLLQLGLLGAGGLSLAGLLRSEARGATGSSDRSVIILWMRGGPSHIDTWDPKPLAPAEYRGWHRFLNRCGEAARGCVTVLVGD